MANKENSNKSPENPLRKKPEISENGQKDETLFSPRFRSVAAMAGWDEEALLVASLIVEDTPDRQSKQKKRSNLPNFKTPPSNSRSKRRALRRGPVSIPVAVLDLDDELDELIAKQDSEKIKMQGNDSEKVVKNTEIDELNTKVPETVSNPAIPCIDRLREELSCAICLEMCYEPSTTPCGHSFCKKCLRSAADKCGKKCPKCRQIISNWRHCTINTVLWNTIQLLFPQEVESRKANASDNSREPPCLVENQTRTTTTTTTTTRPNVRHHRSVQALNSPESEPRVQERRNHRMRTRSSRGGDVVNTRRRDLAGQDEDAALALRLQREEFMEAFRISSSDGRRNNSVIAARANLRAMASRAINIRMMRDQMN